MRVCLTVSELNRTVARSLERGFPPLRVRGELASLTRAASGHWYFTLKDRAAQVRCVMFRSRNALIEFTPREGDDLEVVGGVSLYEAKGEFQLAVESMRRSGQGRLFEQFVRLKERLAAEGLFDEAIKRRLPALPSSIGIVTSLQAAALHDIVTTLRRRAPYVRLIVYPVPVQGQGAGARIARMLATVSARGEVDLVILARGGGSIEDLWAFNEEGVARAIRACAMPVIVGVGHESDFTIADFAADLRAPTPTAAAELAAPDRDRLLQSLLHRWTRIEQLVNARLRSQSQRLDYALRALAAPRAPIRGLQARLDALRARIMSLGGSAVPARATRLNHLRNRIALFRAGVAPARSARLSSVRARMAVLRAAIVTARAARLQATSRALDALDPRQVIGRGYALVRNEQGRLVTDAAQLSAGQPLQLELTRGTAQVRVETARS
ncbi:MAG TPA: exodeoxyribonuclease VII large subunit [Burkholderiaceae bacterium]|nr:exodeoxyribonuclease VII large subunit [Burkholderiaceae bacterium]